MLLLWTFLNDSNFRNVQVALRLGLLVFQWKILTIFKTQNVSTFKKCAMCVTPAHGLFQKCAGLVEQGTLSFLWRTFQILDTQKCLGSIEQTILLFRNTNGTLCIFQNAQGVSPWPFYFFRNVHSMLHRAPSSLKNLKIHWNLDMRRANCTSPSIFS